MGNVNSIKMKEQEESDLEKSIRAHITVVDELPFRIADDDLFLVRKSAEAYKTFEEASIYFFLLELPPKQYPILIPKPGPPSDP